MSEGTLSGYPTEYLVKELERRKELLNKRETIYRRKEEAEALKFILGNYPGAFRSHKENLKIQIQSPLEYQFVIVGVRNPITS